MHHPDVGRNSFREPRIYEHPPGSGIHYVEFSDVTQQPDKIGIYLQSVTEPEARREAQELWDKWNLPVDHPDHFNPWAPEHENETKKPQRQIWGDGGISEGSEFYTDPTLFTTCPCMITFWP